MARYMVQIPYTPDEQLDTLDRMKAHSPGLLAATYWGDMAGETAGWVMVEANSERDARDMLPPILRDSARLAEVRTISPVEIDDMHLRAQAA